MQQPDDLRSLALNDFSFFGFESYVPQLQRMLAKLGIQLGDPALQIADNVTYIPATGRQQTEPTYRGGFISAEGNHLEWSNLRRKGTSVKGAISERVDIETWDEFDGEVVYLGWLFDHFGHFLVESLSRAWFLRNVPSSLPVLFHAPSGTIPVGTIQQVLERFGIPAGRILVPARATKFHRVLVPQSLHELHFRSHDSLPQPYQDVAQQILQDGGIGTSDQPVYISRRLLANDRRELVGAWELEEVLQENGFLIARPETMTFVDQVRLFNRHHDIFAPEQSALNNVLFSLYSPRIHCIAAWGIPQGDYFLLPTVSRAHATFVNGAARYEREQPKGRKNPKLLDLPTLIKYLQDLGFLNRRVRSKLIRAVADLEHRYDEATLYGWLLSARRSMGHLSPEIEQECEQMAETSWPVCAGLADYYHESIKCEIYVRHFVELVSQESNLDRLARYQGDVSRIARSLLPHCSSITRKSVNRVLSDKLIVGT